MYLHCANVRRVGNQDKEIRRTGTGYDRGHATTSYRARVFQRKFQRKPYRRAVTTTTTATVEANMVGRTVCVVWNW